MLKTALVGIALFVSLQAHALNFAFERNYTNYSWGYFNEGCAIDENRNVYIYDFGHGHPMELIGHMSQGAYNKAIMLMSRVARSPYESQVVAADAGSTIWAGSIDGQQIKIREGGNIRGSRMAPETNKLIELIEAFCPRGGGPNIGEPN